MTLLPATWVCGRCTGSGRTVDLRGAVAAAEHHIRRHHNAFGRYKSIHRTWFGLRSRPMDRTVTPDAPRPSWAVIT